MMGVLNKISKCMIFNLLRSLVNWGTLLELLADLERYLVCLQGHLYIKKMGKKNLYIGVKYWNLQNDVSRETFSD